MKRKILKSNVYKAAQSKGRCRKMVSRAKLLMAEIYSVFTIAWPLPTSVVYLPFALWLLLQQLLSICKTTFLLEIFTIQPSGNDII
jgi:hypothetical protein